MESPASGASLRLFRNLTSCPSLSAAVHQATNFLIHSQDITVRAWGDRGLICGFVVNAVMAHTCSELNCHAAPVSTLYAPIAKVVDFYEVS